MPGVARGPTGVIKSILDTSRTGGGRRDEIFVDIVEKISCTFNSAGSIQTSQIDGSVQVPSCRASAQLGTLNLVPPEPDAAMHADKAACEGMHMPAGTQCRLA